MDTNEMTNIYKNIDNISINKRFARNRHPNNLNFINDLIKTIGLDPEYIKLNIRNSEYNITINLELDQRTSIDLFYVWNTDYGEYPSYKLKRISIYQDY